MHKILDHTPGLDMGPRLHILNIVDRAADDTSVAKGRHCLVTDLRCSPLCDNCIDLVIFEQPIAAGGVIGMILEFWTPHHVAEVLPMDVRSRPYYQPTILGFVTVEGRNSRYSITLTVVQTKLLIPFQRVVIYESCLLYTSDAADE